MGVEELFGEGLHWGGLLIVHLLGQSHRYQAFDYCNHLVYIDKLTHAHRAHHAGGGKGAAAENVGQISISAFIDAARAKERRENRILHLLQMHFPEVCVCARACVRVCVCVCTKGAG